MESADTYQLPPDLSPMDALQEAMASEEDSSLALKLYEFALQNLPKDSIYFAICYLRMGVYLKLKDYLIKAIELLVAFETVDGCFALGLAHFHLFKLTNDTHRVVLFLNSYKKAFELLYLFETRNSLKSTSFLISKSSQILQCLSLLEDASIAQILIEFLLKELYECSNDTKDLDYLRASAYYYQAQWKSRLEFLQKSLELLQSLDTKALSYFKEFDVYFLKIKCNILKMTLEPDEDACMEAYEATCSLIENGLILFPEHEQDFLELQASLEEGEEDDVC